MFYSFDWFLIDIESSTFIICSVPNSWLIWKILFSRCILWNVNLKWFLTLLLILDSIFFVMYFRSTCIWFGKISFLWNPCNASCYALCRKLMWNFTGNYSWMIIKPRVTLCDCIQILLHYIQIQILLYYYYYVCKSNSFKSWLLRSQPGLLALTSANKKSCLHKYMLLWLG